MAIRFYNPGSKIQEMMRFDHPTNDIRKQNLVSYFQVNAAAESFFDVPTEMEVETDSGTITIAVKFAELIQHDYREYGVVRIDPKPKKPISETDNAALTEKDAKAKGDGLWKDFLVAKAREHYLMVESAYAHGGIPSRARGIYAHALKVIGMEDPADKVGTAIGHTQESEKVTRLEEQVKQLMEMVTAKGK